MNFIIVQEKLAHIISEELSDYLQCEVTMSKVNLGLLNHITIDDLQVKDREHQTILDASRFSVKLDWESLWKGKISINNIQLFSFHLYLQKKSKDAPFNFQFIVDALASKDSVENQSPIDLRINSVLARRGNISYDINNAPHLSGFTPEHIVLTNFQLNASIKSMSPDSIQAGIKKMSFMERNSGVQLNNLSFKMNGNSKSMYLHDLQISLPVSNLSINSVDMKYDSWQSFKHFSDSVFFNLEELKASVYMKEMQKFIPKLPSIDYNIDCNVSLKGSLNNIRCSKFDIRNEQLGYTSLTFELKNLMIPSQEYFYLRLKDSRIEPVGMFLLSKNYNQKESREAQILRNLHFLNLNGEVYGTTKNVSFTADCSSGIGNLHANGRILNNAYGDYICNGKIESSVLHLNKVFPEKGLGTAMFSMNVEASDIMKSPRIILDGSISNLMCNNYTYRKIRLNGIVDKDIYDGKLSLDDPNVNVFVEGRLKPSGYTSTLDAKIIVAGVKPKDLHWKGVWNDVSNAGFSMDIAMQGHSINDMSGTVKCHDAFMVMKDKKYLTKELVIGADFSKAWKTMHVTGDFINASFEGDFNVNTLPNSFWRILTYHLPALASKIPYCGVQKNTFAWNIQVNNPDMLMALLDVPLNLPYADCSGLIKDQSHYSIMDINIPQMLYDNKKYEQVRCQTKADGHDLNLVAHMSQVNKEETVNFTCISKSSNDSIHTRLLWGNNEKETFSGELNTLVQLKQTDEEDIARVNILPSHIIINDSLWNLRKSQIDIGKKQSVIHNFTFQNGDRSVKIDGILSDQNSDSLSVKLNNINIGYIFDVLDLGVDFKGETTGSIIAAGLLKKPSIKAGIFIKDFSLNDGLLGDAQINGEWKEQVEGIHLKADIRERGVSHTSVDGFIYPLKTTSGLDLHINADNTSLKFVHRYMGEITSDFHARVSGDMRLYGKFNALTLSGKVDADAYFNVDETNVMYHLRDTVIAKPDGIYFNDNRLSDSLEGTGRMSGYVKYNHFQDITCSFDFTTQRMLLMNLQETPTSSFYGTVYGTGKASLRVGENGLKIDAEVSTDKNSEFTYIKDYVNTAVNSKFITFRDKTPQWRTNIRKEKSKEQPIANRESDLRLNLLMDITPDAVIKMVIDPVSKDFIQGRGKGSIRADYYNKDEVKLFGTYTIQKGIYKFSLQDLIHRDFNIQNGSSITFNGLPQNTQLDVKANYLVASASLNDLVPNARALSNQTNLKVNCVLNLSGPLTAPVMKLGIELPNEREEIRSLVHSYISSDEQLNLQFLYLLGVGKFYMPENFGGEQNGSNMMSNVVSSTLSGQLNNALSHIINNNNWNLGTYFSTGEKGWGDVEFEGVLSGQLLNNRLIVNGNFGYRDNPLRNTNFVGDFQTEFLLNKSGDIRLKAYNITNDKYYKTNNFTTQGFGIIFKKDFNKWSDLLFKGKKK